VAVHRGTYCQMAQRGRKKQPMINVLPWQLCSWDSLQCHRTPASCTEGRGRSGQVAELTK
jgi:hypothetical protein